MRPVEIAERYTFEAGDRVRFYGKDMAGIVQSTWDTELPGWDMATDLPVEPGRYYVVTWVTGQTTTVQAGYLLPAGSSHPAVEVWIVSLLALLAFSVGMAIPFIGWLCVATPVLIAYIGYMQNRHSDRRSKQHKQQHKQRQKSRPV